MFTLYRNIILQSYQSSWCEVYGYVLDSKDLLTVLLIAIIAFPVVPLATCTEGDVRLLDGRNEYEGRVEVCQYGIWGTVRHTAWDSLEAAVVCQQLGYHGLGEQLNVEIWQELYLADSLFLVFDLAVAQ